MYDLGMRLKELRIAKGYSLQQLAKKLNLTKGTLSKYESNINTPNINILRELAKLYSVSLDYIAGLDDREMIFVDKLTNRQRDIINTLLLEFRNKQ